MTLPSNAITPVPDIGVLHCTGPDTLSFLQGQLSNDFALLKHNQARLAAFLSAKGRMQASFIAVRYGPHDVLLFVHHSILAAVQKRLSMFILRAKVKIIDASGQWQLLGALGQAVSTVVQSMHGNTVEEFMPWQCFSNTDAQTGPQPKAVDAGGVEPESTHVPAWSITLYPAAQQPRALYIQPSQAQLPACIADLAAPDKQDILAKTWAWSEVLSGIATISAPVVDLFVPQMLNYESVGGINFKKGCYPGQEVVARSQFRGAIKRRTYLAHGQKLPVPATGAEIYSTEDLEQPCGTVVQVAQDPASANGSFDALISIKTDTAAQHLVIRHTEAQAQGEAPMETPISIKAVPYALLEDI
ncbi:folate-binding protein YgfZ [Lampropedia puyangensis]|uniref:Folate-binding protein YgfZ n=1 Tax=Lampropedia puyangensis TaxID=1330072 RepID=A0A4S8FCF5_9BURK|nr:folate-binding protein YgfZ [Lampropedia puyangensis]THU05298.1 folate-binding protein YgfZ [Lampropedia puyangensis]